MKRKTSLILSLMSLALPLGGCGSSSHESIAFTLSGSKPEEFAKQEILTALGSGFKEDGKPGWSITFTRDSTMKAEAFSLQADPAAKSISIVGADDTGLMYGGLELSEKIKENGGIANVTSFERNPSIPHRGQYLKASVDMRAPAYSDNSTSTQKNLPSTWDLSFWDNYFAEMARNHFDLFVLDTNDPRPVFVEVPGYERCALQDVWQTTLEFDRSNGGVGTDLVYNDMYLEGGYRILKKMSIAEKTAFWNQVVELAHNHGVLFNLSIGSLYLAGETYDTPHPCFLDSPTPFADPVEDYGIDNSLENAVTKDYVKKAMRALLKAVPGIDAISLTAGENMETSSSEEGYTEKWLRSVYGVAFEEALQENPQLHTQLKLSLHRTNLTAIRSAWADFTGTISGVGEKYSQQHSLGYSSPDYADRTIQNFRSKVAAGETVPKLFLAIREEDVHHYNWYNPSWVRAYLTHFPKDDFVAGLTFGSDGYNYQRDYMFQDASLNGRLYTQTHFAYTSLIGRLGYDLSQSDDDMAKLLALRFPEVPSATLLAAIPLAEKAADVLVNVGMIYSETGTDRSFYPEMNLSHPLYYGFLSIKDWVKADNAQSGSGVISIAEYSDALAAGKSAPEGTTPLAIAEQIQADASAVTAGYATLKDSLKGDTVNEKDFRNFVLDQLSQAQLGSYYAEKIPAAVALRIYNQTGCKDEAKKAEAVDHLKKAQTAWNEYADNFASRYVVERSARIDIMDPTACKEDVANDVSRAEKWTYKVL